MVEGLLANFNGIHGDQLIKENDRSLINTCGNSIKLDENNLNSVMRNLTLYCCENDA
jgi:hypothetical protein